MRQLYEYLVDDINFNQGNFDIYDRFWIKAITNVIIRGNFEVSEDNIDWDVETEYKLPAGEYIYLFTPKNLKLLKIIGKFNVGGDIRGAFDKDYSKDKRIKGNLRWAFSESDIVDASQLDISGITVAPTYAWCMFNECTLLEKAPKLPATRLSKGCYEFMFDDCVSLIEAPDLPATKLVDECYVNMFRNCKSLKHAPDLPATQLARGCYSAMFMDCTSLVDLPKSSVDLYDPQYCYYMFKNTKFEK